MATHYFGTGTVDLEEVAALPAEQQKAHQQRGFARMTREQCVAMECKLKYIASAEQCQERLRGRNGFERGKTFCARDGIVVLPRPSKQRDALTLALGGDLSFCQNEGARGSGSRSGSNKAPAPNLVDCDEEYRKLEEDVNARIKL
jgi:hypothetical protein